MRRPWRGCRWRWMRGYSLEWQGWLVSSATLWAKTRNDRVSSWTTLLISRGGWVWSRHYYVLTSPRRLPWWRWPSAMWSRPSANATSFADGLHYASIGMNADTSSGSYWVISHQGLSWLPISTAFPDYPRKLLTVYLWVCVMVDVGLGGWMRLFWEGGVVTFIREWQSGRWSWAAMPDPQCWPFIRLWGCLGGRCGSSKSLPIKYIHPIYLVLRYSEKEVKQC